MSIKTWEMGDFQITKISPVNQNILFLCPGNNAVQNKGNMKTPTKSETFPVNQLP